MTKYYLLNPDHSVTPTNDVVAWAKMFENTEKRIVRKTEIKGVFVSTVFLGLDHSFSGGPPLLFETMIFGGKHNDSQWRYSTWEEALAGHERAVKLAKLAKGK